MIDSFIKHFTTIFCSLFLYAKLLNLKLSKKNLFINVIFSAALALCVYYINSYYLPLALPATILISIIYLTIKAKTELGLSITTTILSTGISYAFFTVSALLVSLVLRLIGGYNPRSSAVVSLIFFISISLIQITLIIILFRFRRLKTGMPFLQSKGGNSVGVFISIALLCVVVVIGNGKDANFFYLGLIDFVFVAGFFILLWWRKKLTSTYIERQRSAEMANLQKLLEEKDAYIKGLEQQNDFLANIIHKDNKLIPSMALAVRDYLQLDLQNACENTQEKGALLLEQLETISLERSGLIKDYQSGNKKLPLTHMVSIDALFSYMLNKARESQIEFEVVLLGSVKYLADTIISESDLCTLLADLIENAIIATKNCDGKNILISIGISKDFYQIDIYDSGVPFSLEVLANLGLKKITTHAEEGGSGIGLTTAFKICHKYGASLIIEELASSSSYTKMVSILFDNNNKYIVKSSRKCQLEALSDRDDFVEIC